MSGGQSKESKPLDQQPTIWSNKAVHCLPRSGRNIWNVTSCSALSLDIGQIQQVLGKLDTDTGHHRR